MGADLQRLTDALDDVIVLLVTLISLKLIELWVQYYHTR